MDDRRLTSEAVRAAYTAHYYLEDCGGYETYRAHGGKRLDPRLDCMARLAGCHPGTGPKRILDLGCGRGELTRYFAALGHRVDAIDYAEEALRLAEACFAGEPETRARVRLVCLSITDPNAYQGQYDLVLASDLIEHLAPDEVERLYALIRAHLAPDGLFIAHTFPNLWFYRYDYPRRRRLAELQGESLPAEPRSPYELQMHINEQSPRVMRRQLSAIFEHVLFWGGDHQEPAGSLGRRFGVSDWRAARSLFAIAGRRPIESESVIGALATAAAEVPEPVGASSLPTADRLASLEVNRPAETARHASQAPAPTLEAADHVMADLSRARIARGRLGVLLNRLRRIRAVRWGLDYLHGLMRLAEIPNALVTLDTAHRTRQHELQTQIHELRQALADHAEHLAPDQDLMDWYQDFEEQFRGPPEVIRERLSVYLPYLATAPLSAQTPLLDLGCGRGDWLELLRDQGYPARGVDTHPQALSAARGRGLEVESADVLEWLDSQAPDRLGAVSAFHLVEHLPFGVLLRLLDGAFRALAPEGVLIIETPNPENLAVGACHFHTDPTHLKPVVPAVLEFTARRCGFDDVRLLRLNPDLPEHRVTGEGACVDRLNAVLHGPRDYALVARKPGERTPPGYRFELSQEEAVLDIRAKAILDRLQTHTITGVAA